MTKIHLETDRLILREWEEKDRTPFARMNADPMVMEYFPRHLDEKASNKLMDRFQDNIEKQGYGPYAMEEKGTGEFVGFAGLHNVEIDVPFAPAVEIAWRLDSGNWGRGFATEASGAVLGQAFGELKLKEVVAFSVYDNEAAIHVMEKTGMKRDPKGDFIYPRMSKDHPLGSFVLYRITAKEFKS